MNKASISKAILGSESDSLLLARLNSAVVAIGGTMSEATYSVVGSQEIITYRIDLADSQLTATSETYIGLSLAGPPHIVEQLSGRITSNNSADELAASSDSTSSA